MEAFILMKKSFAVIIPAVVSAALLISGCATTKKTTETAAAPAEPKAAEQIPVVIGAEGVARPAWVMSGMESADGIYAVGSGKMSTRENSLKVARTTGRAELQRTVQTTIKSAITTYAQDTGIPDDKLNYMEEATVDRTAGIMQGSTQKDYWVAQDETVYVLMYLPYNAVVPAANDIVSEYAVDKKSQITQEKVAEALKKYNLLDTPAATDTTGGNQ